MYIIVCEGLSAKTYAVAGISTGISFTGTDTKKGEIGLEYYL